MSSVQQNFTVEGWMRLLLKRPWFWCVMPVLVCLFLASGLSFMKENNDGRIFFAEEDPLRQSLRAMEEQFSESNALLIALAPKEGPVFSREVMTAIYELTDRAWLLPHVSRVNSLSNFQHITSDEEGLIISDLVLDPADIDPQKLSEIVMADGELVGQLVSLDGRVTALSLNFIAPRGDSNVVGKIMGETNDLLKDFQQTYPDITFYVTGDVALDGAFSEAYAYDLGVLFPGMMLMVLLICYLFFRSWLVSVVILVLMMLVVAASMGAAGFVGIELTAGTTAVPIILITIALADFIHILATRQSCMEKGHNRFEAAQEALKSNILPVSLTSLTTIIGFLSLNASDAPPFRDMGNVVAFGIVVSYFLTFTLFPVFLTKINMPPSRDKWCHSLYGGLSRVVAGKPLLILGGMLLLALTLSGGVKEIEFDDDWVKYFDEGNKFRSDTEFVVDHLTGVDSLEYVVTSGGGVTDPDFLNKLDEFAVWVRTEPSVVHVASIVPMFKKLNRHMEGGGQEFYKIAPDAALNAQYLLLYEMSLPMGLDLTDRIDIDKMATRVTVSARDLSSKELRMLDSRISGRLHERGLMAPNIMGSGVPIMFAWLSENNIRSMLWGIAFAMGMVSLIIIIVFRSLTLGLISLVVNFLPIVMGFGIWGWCYQYVGVSITVVAAIAFGIVVDDSIHFMTKFTRIFRENALDVKATLEKTFDEVSNALMMTTAILVLGFGVLAFSAFQPTWSMGVLSAIIILLALLFDFLLLPAFLVLMFRR